MTTTAKRMSKTQLIAELSEKTGMGKKEVQNVFDQLLAIAERELGSNGPGVFTVPDMVTFKVRVTPARAEHMGLNPFTKQEQLIPARPESRTVRASAVKKFKALAG